MEIKKENHIQIYFCKFNLIFITKINILAVCEEIVNSYTIACTFSVRLYRHQTNRDQGRISSPNFSIYLFSSP